MDDRYRPAFKPFRLSEHAVGEVNATDTAAVRDEKNDHLRRDAK
jgi:hypothetical protein